MQRVRFTFKTTFSFDIPADGVPQEVLDGESDDGVLDWLEDNHHAAFLDAMENADIELDDVDQYEKS